MMTKFLKIDKKQTMIYCPRHQSKDRGAREESRPQCMRAQSLSRVQLFVIPWTIACQTPLSMKFFRQEYWHGLPFPPPGDLSNPETEPESLAPFALAVRFFNIEPPGKPLCLQTWG